MLWSVRTKREVLPHAERFRREHSAWLTRAIMGQQSMPVIPTRAEHAGGFDGLRSRPTGLAWAAMWWRLALARISRN